VTPVQLGRGAVTLAAGLLKRSATIPGGVPPQLAAINGLPEKAGDARIAGAPGREYLWDTGTTRTVVLVLPTEAADAALICRGPQTGTETDCRGIAAEVRISGVRLLAPGPPTKFSAALERALRPVIRAHQALGRLSLPTLAKRASRATVASSTDARAARDIRRMDTPARYRTTVGRLADALSGESGRLTSLARVAHRDERSAYARAARATDRASDEVAAASSAALREGLKLHVPARLRLAGPPPVRRAQPGQVTTATTPTYPTTTTYSTTPTTTYQTTPTQPAPPPTTSSTPHTHTTPFS
jgi:hypothetical protein